MEDTSKQTCPECKGDGFARTFNGVAIFIHKDRPCPTCKGTGKEAQVIAKVCKKCRRMYLYKKCPGCGSEEYYTADIGTE